MTRRQLERGKKARALPDVYVGSAERDVEFTSESFRALTEIETTLTERQKRAVERRHGLRPVSSSFGDDD